MDPQNYRPITILSCLGKLFTSILNERLTNFSNIYGITNQNQAGFRKTFSTVDHIFSLYYLINLMKKQKHTFFVGFIDFSRCFDSIPRVELFTKLLNNGVNGKFIAVIRNMYNSIKTCINLKGNIPAFYSPKCGILQGESLSPMLFSFYLNDLQDYLTRAGNTGIDISCFQKLCNIIY